MHCLHLSTRVLVKQQKQMWHHCFKKLITAFSPHHHVRSKMTLHPTPCSLSGLTYCESLLDSLFSSHLSILCLQHIKHVLPEGFGLLFIHSEGYSLRYVHGSACTFHFYSISIVIFTGLFLALLLVFLHSNYFALFFFNGHLLLLNTIYSFACFSFYH